MEFLVGRPVSPGFAQGIAVLFNTDESVAIPNYEIGLADVVHELERLRQALARSSQEMEELEQRVSTELGYAHSSIFSAHLALLHDKGFLEQIRNRIESGRINAEQAVDLTAAELAERMQTLENPYLRERAQDIRDIGRRVLQHLVHPGVRRSQRLESQSVIVARELLPSETIDLDREHVVAIVTEEGGENSHAAILARALGIPAVTGVTGATSKIAPGIQLLVDGQTGRITLAPSDTALDDFRVRRRDFADTASTAARVEFLQCVTLDGTGICLSANINRPAEAQLVADHHLNGVGLFRTEFMFMDSCEKPDLDRQINVYREVINALEGRPLVIRTLDFGGDKVPRFIAPSHEANPTLGLRGLRFSLAHPDILDTQLTAIAAACDRCGIDNVRILLPMVLGESDLQQGVDRFRSIAAQISPQSTPAIGAMIETPSALFALDQILKVADFVSVGTNDLTQFMLGRAPITVNADFKQSLCLKPISAPNLFPSEMLSKND